MYLDANNVRGHSMMQFLPIEALDWFNPINFNLDNYCDNGSKGCFLEVDLDYPAEMHDLHNDCLLSPEKWKSQQNDVWISITNHRRE